MRKGQEAGTNVLYLILLIALFLIAYIILIPESEKEKLIDQPEQVGKNVQYGYREPYPYVKGTIERTVLMSESPGNVYPYSREIFVKPMASVNLFSMIEKEDELLAPLLNLKGGFFGGDSKDLIFKIEDVNAIERINLLFFIQKAKGDIMISLNGKELFNGELATRDLPIELPRSLLKSVNKLTFSASSRVGFLGINEYSLKDVYLFKEWRLENKKETRSFVLTYNDLDNLEVLTLYYFVNCFTINEKGTLTILLNGNLLSEQLIVCDAGEISQDIDVYDLLEGRNILEFRIDNGKYVLEQLSLEGNTVGGTIPTYSFSLQREDYYDLIPVTMELKFLDDRYRKVATILINGYPLYLDTPLSEAFFDITDYVVPGHNIVKIIPDTEFDIIDFGVYLE